MISRSHVKRDVGRVSKKTFLALAAAKINPFGIGAAEETAAPLLKLTFPLDHKKKVYLKIKLFSTGITREAITPECQNSHIPQYHRKILCTKFIRLQTKVQIKHQRSGTCESIYNECSVHYAIETFFCS